MIIDIRDVDFKNETAVKIEIDDFAIEYANADIEYARVICPTGKSFTVMGLKESVDPSLLGNENLQAAVVVHNHPVDEFGDSDSFSLDDLQFAVRYKQKYHFLVFGTQRNAFEFTQFYSEDEMTKAWKIAKLVLLDNARKTNTPVGSEQLGILKILNNTLKGFDFYEDF